ncbi:C40 family peptidase [Cohnella thermotolerans]|jgi:cell wall-associated NlpC family hydrolase|uniref:C40 family peptidase n=1 Tax=Cohnella thermotolerans TaxID=329858 RepID=UPI0003FD84D0|nr:C40 family peptidase [Cohnella thermotolerans]
MVGIRNKMKLKIMAICVLATVGWFGMAAGHSGQASAATEESLELLSIGKEFIGTPYLYGSASGSTDTFDCSSFVQYVFKQQNISLPRTASAQATVGEKVTKAYLSVGDLVFFKSGGSGIGHVAIYAGNGKILHATSSQGVTISNLNSSYWSKNYVTARRVL